MNKEQKRMFQTLKWLVSIPSKRINGNRPLTYYGGRVLARFGRFYATNGYILACVEWDSMHHAGWDEWEQLELETLYDGKRLQAYCAKLEPAEFAPNNDAVFEQMFFNECLYDSSQAFAPQCLTEALKPFQYNGLYPVISQFNERLELAAHNDSVSIKVLTMGVRL